MLVRRGYRCEENRNARHLRDKGICKTANLSRPLVGDASPSLCKTLVALPVRRVPCLFTFDYNGAPEQMTSELPFVALGSGQPIADPFLALLKRLFWLTSQPTLGRGACSCCVDH